MTMHATHIDTVSKQWASRPDDQRFLSVADLYARVQARREGAKEIGMALEHLRIDTDTAGRDLILSTEAGKLGSLTHYAFGQLCARAKVNGVTTPAGYLRALPAELARINLQWGMEHGDRDDGKILTYASRRDVGESFVSAITSDTYGRIWDADVVKGIMTYVDLDTWKVPGASYASKDPKRATTLYASDRDVFLFLVNESNPIEVDGETMFRGFYTWNSEVGSKTFGIATFLYRYVCDNRNIWGPKDFREITIRHTSGGPHRFAYQAAPTLKAYVNSSTRETVETIRAARAKEVAKDRAGVTEWLKARGFTLTQAKGAYDAAERDSLNPRSVWGIVQGLTDTAHSIAHTDERTDLERKAGKLLDAVYAVAS